MKSKQLQKYPLEKEKNGYVRNSLYTLQRHTKRKSKMTRTLAPGSTASVVCVRASVLPLWRPTAQQAAGAGVATMFQPARSLSIMSAAAVSLKSSVWTRSMRGFENSGRFSRNWFIVRDPSKAAQQSICYQGLRTLITRVVRKYRTSSHFLHALLRYTWTVLLAFENPGNLKCQDMLTPPIQNNSAAKIASSRSATVHSKSSHSAF